MLQKRFNSLAILNSYKKVVNNLDLIEVGNEFVAKHESRKITFGTCIYVFLYELYYIKKRKKNVSEKKN